MQIRSRKIFTAVLAMLFMLIIFTGCAKQKTEVENVKFYDCNGTQGYVSCDIENFEELTDGQEITLKAENFQGYVFSGWTINTSIENNGKLLSDNSEITVKKEASTVYYANFIPEGQIYLRYYANGGKINYEGSNRDSLVLKVELGNHKYPATLPQNGIFFREGYVLTEYNSKADGNGNVTNIGQRAFSEGRIIDLYAQWSKETDVASFTFKKKDGGVYVTGYEGKDKVLTVPSHYEDKAVVGIAESAISSSSIKTLVLPETVTTIEEDAFEGCSSLAKVYLYDTVTDMSDDSFSDSPIKTVCLNSTNEKKYYAEGAGKLELLCSQENKEADRVVVISGSSSVFGLDSEVVKNSLKKEYDVVNLGLHTTIPGSLVMTMIKDYLHKGDVVVFAPECEFKQFGNTLSVNTFEKFDGVYTSMRKVNVGEYDSFFTALAKYCLEKPGDTEKMVDDAEQFYSDNGDSVNTREHKEFSDSYKFRSPVKHENMRSAVYKRNNLVIDALKKKGVKVYLSFAPFCSEACEGKVTKEQLDAYSETLAEKLNAVCISTQSDYDYPAKHFFEMFHLTAEGRKLRSEQLAKDLNAQLSKESKSSEK